MFKFIGEGTVGLVTTFGKYQDQKKPGFAFYWPIIQTVYIIPTRVQNMNQKTHIKTKDDVFATLDTNIIYRVSNPRVFCFDVSNAVGIMSALVEKELRAEALKHDLDELFCTRQDLQDKVTNKLSDELESKGIEVEQIFVSDIIISEELKKAKQSVATELNNRKAMENKAESNKIQLVKEAEAHRDRMLLQGEGIAGMRQKIVDGFEGSIEKFEKLKIPPNKAMDFILNSMIVDSYKEMATSKNAKVIFYPTSLRDAPFMWNPDHDSETTKTKEGELLSMSQ